MKIKLLSRVDREEMVKKLATLDESSDEAKALRTKLERNICLPSLSAAFCIVVRLRISPRAPQAMYT